jgi:hypothetical protein
VTAEVRAEQSSQGARASGLEATVGHQSYSNFRSIETKTEIIFSGQYQV